jgi:hypothetical protein
MGLPSFDCRSPLVLILNTDSIVDKSDSSSVNKWSDLFRYAVVIVFLGVKADPQPIEKLTTEAELSGLLKAVLWISRVLNKGIQTTSSTIDENYTRYILSSDPLRAFVETALEPEIDSNTLKTEIYESYKMFCRAKSPSPVSEGSFSRRMTKQRGFKCEQFRDGKGTRTYYYLGVKIRDWKTAKERQSILWVCSTNSSCGRWTWMLCTLNWLYFH